MAVMLKVDRDRLSTVQTILFNRHFPQDVSDRQAEMMLHALGADNQPARTYRSNRFYHAYRNHFDAGGADVAEWTDLVAKGYAEKHTFYHVTVKGIHLLEWLTQCRIWDARHNVADCRRAVLEELMKDAVSCGYGCWLPTSSRELSLRLAVPQKLVLETLRQLAEEGLAKRDFYGEMDEDGYVHCKHGWTLTLAGEKRYPDRYEALKQAEYKRINDSLRGDADG